MRNNGLNPNQEAYARGVLFERKTKRQAYRDAYPNASKSTDKQIDNYIRNLEMRDGFKRGYKKLQDEAEKELNITRDDVLRELHSIGFSTDYKKFKVKDKLTALGMIVDILGYKNAQKVDMNVTEGNQIIRHLHLPKGAMEDYDEDGD